MDRDAVVSPDWSLITEQICCPLCDYELRGLQEPRCPECGYQFEWPELIDPAKRRHPYLFEHRRNHLVASFFRTFAACLWPPVLWRRLHPAQPSSTKRLIMFWLLLVTPILVASSLEIAAGIREYTRLNAQARKYVANLVATSPEHRKSMLAGATSVQAMLDRDYPEFPTWNAWPSTRPGVQLFTWSLLPIFSFLCLLLYQTSMRRARLKPIHVFRCVVYSSSPILLLGLYGVGLAAYGALFDQRPASGHLLASPSGYLPDWYGRESVLFMHWAMITWTLAMAIPLASAYKRYLRLSNPFIGVALTQVLVLLLSTLMMYLGWI